MKPSRPALPAISAFLFVLLTAVFILVWLKIRPQSSPTPTQPPASSPSFTPSPPSTPPASDLRGRRGIIREITDTRVVIETTDSYAIPDEHVTVKVQPNTSFILITIPKTPQIGEEVTRTPMDFPHISVGDNVFVIGFQNITASTSFSALRIEKIINP